MLSHKNIIGGGAGKIEDKMSIQNRWMGSNDDEVEESLIDDFRFLSIDDKSKKKYKFIFDFNENEDIERWVFRERRYDLKFFDKISVKFPKIGGGRKMISKYLFDEDTISIYLIFVYKCAIMDTLKYNELSSFTCVIINTLYEFIQDNEEEFIINKIIDFLNLFEKRNY